MNRQQAAQMVEEQAAQMVAEIATELGWKPLPTEDRTPLERKVDEVLAQICARVPAPSSFNKIPREPNTRYYELSCGKSTWRFRYTIERCDEGFGFGIWKPCALGWKCDPKTFRTFKTARKAQAAAIKAFYRFLCTPRGQKYNRRAFVRAIKCGEIEVSDG